MSYNDDNYNLDFNSHIAAEMCVEWIRDWFENNGNGCKAVIGISGGKDSSVVAALCVKALGKERVFGVLMPNGEQADINYANELCEFLGINNVTINIESVYDTAIAKISDALETTLSEQTTINLPARCVWLHFMLYRRQSVGVLLILAIILRIILVMPQGMAMGQETWHRLRSLQCKK